MEKFLDLYVVSRTGGRYTLFSPPDSLAGVEEHSTDRVRHFIDWLCHRRSRPVAWVGRGVRSLHDYYETLEEKIDPAERVLKAMASANRYVVYTPVREAFTQTLRRQKRKHVLWFSLDFVFTGVVVMFTPILAPIPGPNLFFYYPFLRLLSHYRAILGALSGLSSTAVEYKDLRESSGLEDNLPGLARFMERME